MAFLPFQRAFAQHVWLVHHSAPHQDRQATLLQLGDDDLARTDVVGRVARQEQHTDRDVAGADTVIIDDKPVLAGSRLAIECVGKKIRTVESLRNGDKIDEVIQGFVKHDAMQCGMCTPGFVMATRAFLDKNPNATLEQIQAGLGGNICRCGTYDGITKCALELAKGGA